MKKILLYSLLILSAISAAAQSNNSSLSAIRSYLDEMFSTLDKTKVPTGFLSDYAVNLVDFNNYSGQLVDSNYVDAACYADILYSINSSKVSGDSLAIYSTINTFHQGATQSSLKASIALFQYNYIVENALSDGLITYVNDKVADVYENNVWKDPYGTNYILGFATNAPSLVLNTVSISFPSSLFLTNISASLELDAGDGQGYRQISLGSTLNISYSESGFKELKLKVTLASGTILYAHSFLLTIDSPIAPNSTIANETTIISTTYSGTPVSAKVSFKYGGGRTDIEKPFIVAEGFDPFDLIKEFDSSLPDGYLNIDTLYVNASDTLKSYDIIYIDWLDYKEDIRANAKLFQEIITWVNTIKHNNGSNCRNIVYAESMGGLIANYALWSMEQNGILHETDYFISNDAPYYGANVPIGAQYVLQDLLKKASVLSFYLKKYNVYTIINEIFTAKSVKQLLYCYVNSNLGLTSNEHILLENEMTSMGLPRGDSGYPIENIALVSGGYFNKNGTLSQSLFALNAPPLASGYMAADGLTVPNLIINMLLNFVLLSPRGGFRSLRYDFEAYPYVSYGQLLMNSHLTYEKFFLWVFGIEIPLDSKTKYAPSFGLTYDSLPGSYYNLDLILSDVSSLNYDKKLIGSAYTRINYVDRFMFVPTASALRINNPTNINYYKNYYSNLPAPFIETPFQSFALADSSRFHTDLSLNQKNFLDNILSLNISGPSTLEPGDTTYQYTYSAGYSDIISLTWSTSNSNVATINGSTGVLTPVGTGGVDVILSGSGNGKYYYKKKHVVIGFPEVRITKSAWGNTTILNAQCVSADEAPFLQQGVSNGSILFQWGIKYDYGSITWNTPTNSSSFSIQLTNATSITTVFLRLVDGNNQSNTGAVVHKTIQRPDPLVANISQLGKMTTGETLTALAFSVPDMFDENNNIYLVLKEDVPGVLDDGLSYYKVGTRTGKVYRNHEDTIQGYKYHYFDFRSQSVVNLELNSLYQNLHNVGDVETLIIKAYDEYAEKNNKE